MSFTLVYYLLDLYLLSTMNNISPTIEVVSTELVGNRLVINCNFLDKEPDTTSHAFLWLLTRWFENSIFTNYNLDNTFTPIITESKILVKVIEISDIEYFINNLQ